MKYEVTIKCICVEVAEDGTRQTLLDDGPTWKGLQYNGMVGIQQLVLKVINAIGSWGVARLSAEDKVLLDEMIK
jgi:hypothetical protein